MPKHNQLSGSQLHEMKGAAAAAAGQVPIADGAGSTAFTTPPWGQAAIIKYKDADNTAVNNSTTLVNDDDLLNFSLSASTVYLIEADIYVTSADGSTNIDMAFNLVSGSLTDSSITWTSHEDDGDVVINGAAALTDEVTVTSLAGTNSVLVHVSGFVSVNAASVVSLQFAQNSAVATDSQTLKGSWIKFTQVE